MSTFFLWFVPYFLMAVPGTRSSVPRGPRLLPGAEKSAKNWSHRELKNPETPRASSPRSQGAGPPKGGASEPGQVRHHSSRAPKEVGQARSPLALLYWGSKSQCRQFHSSWPEPGGGPRDRYTAQYVYLEETPGR